MGDAARVIMCNAVIDELLSEKIVEKTVSFILLSFTSRSDISRLAWVNFFMRDLLLWPRDI